LFDQTLAPGQKRKREDWEYVVMHALVHIGDRGRLIRFCYLHLRLIYYIGIFGGMAFAAVLLTYKPNTRYVGQCDRDRLLC
jgi:hypothetical protein